jgi:hypothetical protein
MNVTCCDAACAVACASLSCSFRATTTHNHHAYTYHAHTTHGGTKLKHLLGVGVVVSATYISFDWVRNDCKSTPDIMDRFSHVLCLSLRPFIPKEEKEGRRNHILYHMRHEAATAMTTSFFFRRTQIGGFTSVGQEKSKLCSLVRWFQRRLMRLCDLGGGLIRSVMKMIFLSFSDKGRRTVVEEKKAAVPMMITVTMMMSMLLLMLPLVLTSLMLFGSSYSKALNCLYF